MWLWKTKCRIPPNMACSEHICCSVLTSPVLKRTGFGWWQAFVSLDGSPRSWSRMLSQNGSPSTEPGGKKSLQHYCCTASAGAGRQKPHILPTPSLCQVSCFQPFPFLGWFEMPAVHQGNEKKLEDCPEADLLPPHSMFRAPLPAGQGHILLQDLSNEHRQACMGFKATPSSKHHLVELAQCAVDVF